MARISVACHDGTSYIQCGTLRSGLLSMQNWHLHTNAVYGKYFMFWRPGWRPAARLILCYISDSKL